VTIYGVDIAGRSGANDFQHGLDMATVKKDGFTFVTARAVAFPHGSIAEDGDYAIFRGGCKANGLLFAAYLLPHTNYTPAAQAQKLADVIGDKTIPVMIDWESDGTWSVPSYSFACEVRDACEARGLHVATLYGPHWYWSSMGSPTLTNRPWRLVSSTYGNNSVGSASTRYASQGGASGAGWDPYGGLKPSIWQFGSQIRCAGQLVDGDAYEGTLASLVSSGMFTNWNGDPPVSATGPENWDGNDDQHFRSLVAATGVNTGQQLLDAARQAADQAVKAVAGVNAVNTELDTVRAQNQANAAAIDGLDAKLDQVLTALAGLTTGATSFDMTGTLTPKATP
jgi:hypothetical protein